MKSVVAVIKSISVLFSLVLLASFLPVQVASARYSEPEFYAGASGSCDVAPVVSSMPDQIEVPLITGDTVVVYAAPDGTRSYAILQAEDQTCNGYFVFQKPSSLSTGTGESNTATYVIPNDIDLDLFDLELFNIDYLIEEKYNELSYIPVLIVEEPDRSPDERRATGNVIVQSAASVEAHDEIMTTAAKFSVNTAGNTYSMLQTQSTISKVWLDRTYHVSLSESVPLISAPEIWDNGFTGAGINIAILDTGIDATHPDLDDLDDDPVTIDPKVIVEVNFTTDSSINDLNGHGTHCASIAAGTGSIYTGVAPGAYLYNIKVLGESGKGSSSWIIAGIDYAVRGPDGVIGTDDDADVLNLSLGNNPGDGTDPVSLKVEWAVEQGAVVVIACGNEGDEYFTASAPGVAQNVITVGASDKSDQIADFSGRGPTMDFRIKPDVLAPGVDIVAALASGTSAGNPVNDYYTSLDGTSMAAPHVAGAAALILEANSTLPSGWDAPTFVKSTLMSNAVDLGYDVYTQGAGRVDLAASTEPVILIDPPTTSFGNYGGVFTSEQVLTFYNNDSIPHQISLTPSLTELVTSSDSTGLVSLTSSVLTIPAGDSVSTTLNLNTSGITKGMYSGRIEAVIDTGGTVQSIFGFGMVTELTVDKIDRSGNAGADHFVCAFSDGDDPWSIEAWTDSTGRATFFVPDDTYQIISYSLDENDAVTWTFDQVTVTGGVAGAVTLDERNAVLVDFNPNKTDQHIAEKTSQMYFYGSYDDYWYRYMSIDPGSTATYVQPTTTWNSNYTYSFYPAEYYSDSVLDTPEWSKLRYGLETISDPVTFIADYTTTVTRETVYTSTTSAEQAVRVQFAMSGPGYSDVTKAWDMKIPVIRTEILSPSPVSYDGYVIQDGVLPNWTYRTINPVSYSAGETTLFTFGRQPFNFGMSYALGTNLLYLKGGTNADTSGNIFNNPDQSPLGYVSIQQNGTTTAAGNIFTDYGIWGIPLSGTPDMDITIDGWSGMDLATTTKTVLHFVADSNIDYLAPEFILTVDESAIDLYNGVVYGDIPLILSTYDSGTGVASAVLEYSIDDGSTWSPATLSSQGSGVYTSTITLETGDYISFRVTVTDNNGNSRLQQVIRGVSLSEEQIIINPVVPLTTDFDQDIAPSLVKLNSGNLFIAWVRDGDILYRESDDDGDTWTTETLLATTDYEYDLSAIQADDGTIWVAWGSFSSGNSDIWYMTSIDDGTTWTDGVQLTVDTEYDYSPEIVQLADGSIAVFWVSERSGNADIWYKISSDNGVTWSGAVQLTSDSSADLNPETVLLDSGELGVFWDNENNLWYKTSDDNGDTWSVAAQLTDDPGYEVDPSVVQQPDGTVVLAWETDISSNPDIWMMKSMDDGATWTQPEQFTHFAGNDASPSIAALDDNTIGIAWTSDRSGNDDIWFGIPGYLDDIQLPPYVTRAWHDPVPNPDSDEVVTITAELVDESGIISPALVWSVDSVSQADLPLYNDGTNGDITAGDDMWAVQIGPFDAGAQVSYQIQVSDQDSHTVLAPSIPVVFQVLEPWVAENASLLVMDTMTDLLLEPSLTRYREVLDAASIDYDVWDASLRGMPDASELSLYLDGVVIWGDTGYSDFRYLTPSDSMILAHNYTPDNQDILTSLKNFLESGGRLFLSVNGIAGTIDDPEFLTEYLHASYQGFSGSYEMVGVDDDPVSDGLTLTLSKGAENINVVSPAVPIFTYNYDSLSGTTGLRIDNGVYRLIFLPFEFNSISSSLNRQLLIERSFDWLMEDSTIVVTRYLPESALPGETFNVTANFTFPYDDLLMIGLEDYAPEGWTVAIDQTWCLPAPVFTRTTDNQVEVIWSSPFSGEREFSVTYSVTVPINATGGVYSFGDGFLLYTIGTHDVMIPSLSGDYQIQVLGGSEITGVVYEVDGSILDGVTVTIDGGSAVLNESDGSYRIAVTTTGEYTVTVSKPGFRERSQTITISDLTMVYTLDFKATSAMVPDAPDMLYVLACINKWKYPPGDGTDLNISKILEVINAWKYPQ